MKFHHPHCYSKQRVFLDHSNSPRNCRGAFAILHWPRKQQRQKYTFVHQHGHARRRRIKLRADYTKRTQCFDCEHEKSADYNTPSVVPVQTGPTEPVPTLRCTSGSWNVRMCEKMTPGLSTGNTRILARLAIHRDWPSPDPAISNSCTSIRPKALRNTGYFFLYSAPCFERIIPGNDYFSCFERINIDVR